MPEVVRYDGYGLKFAISVSWHVLQLWSANERSAPILGPEKHALVRRALARWRHFLLDRAPHPSEFEQAMLPLHLTEMRWRDSLRRSTNTLFVPWTITSHIQAKSCLLTARLAASHVSVCCRRIRAYQARHQTACSKGVLTLRNAWIELPHAVVDFLNDRAEYAAHSMDSVSPRQKSKIESASRQRLASNPTGEMIEALLRDYELFARKR